MPAALLAVALFAAASPPEPLACVPAPADFVAAVERPRELVEAVVGLRPVKEFAGLEGAKEFLEGTGPRRFFQFLAYYERELGHPWPELIDRLAGGGVYLAAKQGAKPDAAVLVVRARDAELLQRFAAAALVLVEQELARQDSREKVERKSHAGTETIHVGKNVHAAVTGPTLVVASTAEALRLTLDTIRGDKPGLASHKGPAAAKALVGPDALAWAWSDLAPAKGQAGAKEVLKLPRADANQTVLFGGWLDAFARSSFAAAGLVKSPGGLTATVRLPAGRDGLPPGLALHVPPPGQPGTKPDLNPKGLLFGSSFYLDLAKMWTEREKLFTPRQVKDFEKLDKDGGRFLKSVAIGTLLQQTGPYHRVVVAASGPLDYELGRREVQFGIPAFAAVTTMRDPAFGKSLDAVLRGVALAAGTQVTLKYAEEKVNGVKLVGWRFPEDGEFKNDRGNNRFNFSPCFAAVGDQFFAASTLPLGRELIGLLQAEQSSSAPGRPEATRMRFRAAGAADLLGRYPEQVVTGAVLDRFVSWSEGRRQAEAFLAWLRRSGGTTVTADYGPAALHIDIAYSADD